VLIVLMAGLGVLSSVLVGRIGVLAPVVIVLVFASVFVLPLSLRQAVTRFRGLRTQLTWWHGLWLLVFLSGFQFRLRDTQAIKEAAVDFAAVYRIALMAITAFALGVRLVLRRAPHRLSLFRGPIGALALYAVICVASTLWSVFPAWTLYKSLEYLVDVVLLAAILATFPSVEAYKCMFDWTWTLDGFLLVSVWLGALMWPGEALQPSPGLIRVQLQGVAPQISDNGVGHLSAVLSLVALSRLLRKPQSGPGTAFYAVLFALGLATLFVAQTRSAMLGFLFGVALLLYLSGRMGSIAFIALTAVLLYVFTSADILAEQYVRRGQSADLFNSLSGRTVWWDAAWQVVVKSPWIGMGASTARFTVLEILGDVQASTLHNTYLETLVGVGIAGFIPLVATILWLWRILIRELRDSFRSPTHRQLAIEAIAVLGLITCRSFFSVPLIVHPDLDSLAVVGYAELLRRSWK
jgi:hypothetical protein